MNTAMARKYHWDEWLGKAKTIIRQGLDYQCSQSTMAQTIRNAASARGIRVKLTDTGCGFEIEVRKKAGTAPNEGINTKVTPAVAQ